MAERNIKLLIEYRGTSFSGWQIQSDQPTVQEILLDAIYRVTGSEVNLLGAGRTDSGVHALGQVANFRIDHSLAPERYASAINSYLPDDIRVRSSEAVPLEFHARYDARHRRYRYLLADERSALYRELRWELPEKLDFELLRESAKLLLGEHDFTPFCVVASRKECNICRIDRSDWHHIGPLLVYEIRGNRFLHSMVRSLVGAMVNLARVKPDNNLHNLTMDRFKDMLSAPSTERLRFTAPPHGLYLVSVGYEHCKETK
jgi:tRNA pseudouridine38-40 synthase